MPDDRPRRLLETPTGDPCPHVEVDVLVEGEVGLIVPAEVGEQLASQQAGGAADTDPRAPFAAPRPLLPPHPQLESAAVAGQRLAGAVDASRVDRGGPLRGAVELADGRLHAAPGPRRLPRTRA